MPRSPLPRSPKIWAGLVIVVFFVLLAAVGPLLVGDPIKGSPLGLTGPSGAHWLGTTQSGQDVLAQLVNGARVSLGVGFLSATIATARRSSVA